MLARAFWITAHPQHVQYTSIGVSAQGLHVGVAVFAQLGKRNTFGHAQDIVMNVLAKEGMHIAKLLFLFCLRCVLIWGYHLWLVLRLPFACWRWFRQRRRYLGMCDGSVFWFGL